MVIRPYISNDKIAVIELLKSNTPNFFDPSEKKDFKKFLNEKVEDYYVVETGNKEIIGSGGINYFLEERTARISWDIIRSDAQGKGIGRKMIEHKIRHLNNNNEIDLVVVRTTQLVYKFYEKVGFKLMEIRKDFWTKGFDLYLMELENTKYKIT